MIKFTSDKFVYVLPLASEWAEAKEKVVLKHGDPLSISQTEDANRVGVMQRRLLEFLVSRNRNPDN